MASSMGGLAQQHSAEAPAAASCQKNTILIQSNTTAKCWGRDWKFFFFAAVVNAAHNFAGLKPAKSPPLWEQVLLREGLRSSLDYVLYRAYLTALNLEFNLKKLEFWFKTYSWSVGQLNLQPKAREDEIASGEQFEVFTSAMKANAGLISRSWTPQEKSAGQREMSQR